MPSLSADVFPCICLYSTKDSVDDPTTSVQQFSAFIKDATLEAKPVVYSGRKLLFGDMDQGSTNLRVLQTDVFEKVRISR